MTTNPNEEPPCCPICDQAFYFGKCAGCGYATTPNLAPPSQPTPPSPSALVECKRLIAVMDALGNDCSITGYTAYHDAKAEATEACIAYVRSLPTAPESAPDVSLEEELRAKLGDLLGIGSAVRDDSTILTNVRNLQHFARCLDAVERAFFMVPGVPDISDPDFDPEDEVEPVCLLNRWGSTPEQYVEQFRVALESALRAQSPAEGEFVVDGWTRAADDEMVCAFLGVANSTDSYEVAKAKLRELIQWNIDVATDHRVNGGFVLVPMEPTPEMLANGALMVLPRATAADIELAARAVEIVVRNADYECGPADLIAAQIATMAPFWRAMLAAAPEGEANG